MKILLIEDNPADIRLIKELLKKTSLGPFEINTCTRLSEGLDYIKKKNIDVILLDLTLPDSDKDSTLSSILGYTLKYPIIILTGYDDKEIALNSLNRGIQDYLVKGELNETILARSILYGIERHKIKVQDDLNKVGLASLDNKDKMILNILQENYKISFKEISKRIHLAASTIHARVKNMISEGIIEKFDTLINPYKVGYETIAFISLSIDPSNISEISNKLKYFDEIQLIAGIAGEFNLLLQIITKNEKELWELINKEIKPILETKSQMNVFSIIDVFKRTLKIKLKIED